MQTTAGAGLSVAHTCYWDKSADCKFSGAPVGSFFSLHYFFPRGFFFVLQFDFLGFKIELCSIFFRRFGPWGFMKTYTVLFDFLEKGSHFSLKVWWIFNDPQLTFGWVTVVKISGRPALSATVSKSKVGCELQVRKYQKLFATCSDICLGNFCAGRLTIIIEDCD